MSTSSVPPLLCLCARAKINPDIYARIGQACTAVSDWDSLLDQAEAQGVAPLVNAHLSSHVEEVPLFFMRGLRFLCLRHRQANAAFMQGLYEVLSLLADAGISSLVLKGAALCHTVYPEIALRPMRDIDLLLSEEDVYHGHELLLNNGFQQSCEQLPEDYYHLQPLIQEVNGLRVCVELHRGLFPNEPPYYTPLPFAELYRRARPFAVHGLDALTLADEDMLWHLYQHGFHAPLSYEPFRLISAADIVSLVEDRVEALDWDRISRCYPELYRALPHFHYLTPWTEKVLKRLPGKIRKTCSGVGKPFAGWPRLQLYGSGLLQRLRLVQATFFPGRWWLMLYYSTCSRSSFAWSRYIRHPFHVCRWFKLRGFFRAPEV
jgi:hypothetical protein